MSSASVSLRPLKPHKTLDQLVEVLASRGLVIGEKAEALETLKRLGYYRLAGYFYTLRRTKPPGVPGRQDDFVSGASLDLIVRLYEFDRLLRLLAMDAIERLEVAIRVSIAHELGRLHPDAHCRQELFDAKFTRPPSGIGGASEFDRWHEKLRERLRNRSGREDEFVKHHNSKYGGHMPIWAAIELWDFGMLSRFYEGMRFKEKNRVSAQWGRLDGPQFESWLRTLNFLRNVAAHHSRLWNRNVPEVPRLPPPETHRLLAHLHGSPGLTRVYGALCCTQFLLRDLPMGRDWAQRLKAHVASFPSLHPQLTLTSAGFPHEWQSMQLWN